VNQPALTHTQPATLAQHLEASSTTEGLPPAVVALVGLMLGTEPHSNRFLNIHPLAYQTEGLIVPNFLNIPGSLLGVGSSLPLVGLAMFASSRAAACPYCTAHSAAFAMRRGLGKADAWAAVSDPERLSPLHRAVVRYAEGIGQVPARADHEAYRQIVHEVGSGKAEWIGLGAVMMGYLNGVMTSLGLPLEASILEDVGDALREGGWEEGVHRAEADRGKALPLRADSWRSLLAFVPHLPGGLLYGLRATKGVPSKPELVAAYVRDTLGLDLPLVASIGPAGPRQAIAAVLRDQLHGAALDVDIKANVAMIYAMNTGAGVCERLAVSMGCQRAILRARFGERWVDLDDPRREADALDIPPGHAAALLFAQGASESPARLPSAVVDFAAEHVPAPALVDLVSWLGVLGLLRRESARQGLEETL